jgi:hypothetical protein
MNSQIIVQYVGFQVTSALRQYTFAVRETATEPLQYTLTIANEAFVSHRVRYQDAPQICSLRLRRELDAHANHPLANSFCVTDTELATYQDAHVPKANRGLRKRGDGEN